MPPRVSPTQLIVIPIPNAKLSADARAALTGKARELAAELAAAGVRTDSDLRDNYTPGWKYNYWELKARLCTSRRHFDTNLRVVLKRHDGCHCQCEHFALCVAIGCLRRQRKAGSVAAADYSSSMAVHVKEPLPPQMLRRRDKAGLLARAGRRGSTFPATPTPTLAPTLTLAVILTLW